MPTYLHSHLGPFTESLLNFYVHKRMTDIKKEMVDTRPNWKCMAHHGEDDDDYGPPINWNLELQFKGKLMQHKKLNTPLFMFYWHQILDLFVFSMWNRVGQWRYSKHFLFLLNQDLNKSINYKVTLAVKWLPATNSGSTTHSLHDYMNYSSLLRAGCHGNIKLCQDCNRPMTAQISVTWHGAAFGREWRHRVNANRTKLKSDAE